MVSAPSGYWFAMWEFTSKKGGDMCSSLLAHHFAKDGFTICEFTIGTIYFVGIFRDTPPDAEQTYFLSTYFGHTTNTPEALSHMEKLIQQASNEQSNTLRGGRQRP